MVSIPQTVNRFSFPIGPLKGIDGVNKCGFFLVILKHLILTCSFLAVRVPGGFRKPREAYKKHFHLSEYLSDSVGCGGWGDRGGMKYHYTKCCLHFSVPIQRTVLISYNTFLYFLVLWRLASYWISSISTVFRWSAGTCRAAKNKYFVVSLSGLIQPMDT